MVLNDRDERRWVEGVSSRLQKQPRVASSRVARAQREAAVESRTTFTHGSGCAPYGETRVPCQTGSLARAVLLRRMLTVPETNTGTSERPSIAMQSLRGKGEGETDGEGLQPHTEEELGPREG